MLDVADQARMFARSIVSQSLQPPLAIGLFGDWGSGKSYFMHLLREAAREECRKPGSWSEVCHIEFNAWHYAPEDAPTRLLTDAERAAAKAVREDSGKGLV